MPSRSSREAVAATRDRLQSIAACFTDRFVITVGDRSTSEPAQFVFAPPAQPVPLLSVDRSRQVMLSMSCEYVIDNDSVDFGFVGVRLIGYRFDLLDRQEREILTYHWHPHGVSPITYPHLHLSGRIPPLDLGPRDAPVPIGEMHLPTAGRVTLADITNLLIAEFGVAPRRPDWDVVLATVGDPFAQDQ